MGVFQKKSFTRFVLDKAVKKLCGCTSKPQKPKNGKKIENSEELQLQKIILKWTINYFQINLKLIY